MYRSLYFIHLISILHSFAKSPPFLIKSKTKILMFKLNFSNISRPNSWCKSLGNFDLVYPAVLMPAGSPDSALNCSNGNVGRCHLDAASKPTLGFDLIY